MNVEPIIQAGEKLANCAFNLSQRDTIDDHTRGVLRQWASQWGDAIRPLNQARTRAGDQITLVLSIKGVGPGETSAKPAS